MSLFSRREAGKLAVGAGVAGLFSGSASAGKLNSLREATSAPPPQGEAACNIPIPPKMPREDAVLRFLKDAHMKAELKKNLYRHYKQVSYLDPDLEVLKGVSKMAKVTIQRQRNVQAAFDRITEPCLDYRLMGPSEYNPVADWFSDKISDIMWGRK